MSVVIGGNLTGPIVVEADTVLRGNLRGNVSVHPGCLFEMSGNMTGDILLYGDARADVSGNLRGNIRQVAAVGTPA